MSQVAEMHGGGLYVSLQRSAGRYRAFVRNERPLLASCLLEGRPLLQTLTVVPLLFSVCAHAQSIAAIRAAEQALGVEAETAVQQQRELLLALEMLREHLWRFFIDWPSCLGGSGDSAAFAPLNRQLLQLANALNRERQLTASPAPNPLSPGLSLEFIADWQRLKPVLKRAVFGHETVDTMLDTLPGNGPAERLLATIGSAGYADLGQACITALPAMSASPLASLLAGDTAEQFVRYPRWAGQSHETGPYTRQALHPLTREQKRRYGDGVAARMCARLAELLILCDRIDAGIAGVSLHQRVADSTGRDSSGIAQVEAARGRLVHYLQLAGDTVVRYRIVAPTEWNFHPEGVFVDMIAGLDSDGEELLRQSRLLACLVDPCVPCQLDFAGQERSPHSDHGRVSADA